VRWLKGQHCAAVVQIHRLSQKTLDSTDCALYNMGNETTRGNIMDLKTAKDIVETCNGNTLQLIKALRQAEQDGQNAGEKIGMENAIRLFGEAKYEAGDPVAEHSYHKGYEDGLDYVHQTNQALIEDARVDGYEAGHADALAEAVDAVQCRSRVQP